jgi:hypothetical protein
MKALALKEWRGLPPIRLSRNSRWRQRNGMLIAVADMDSGHIARCIACLEFRSPIGTVINFRDPQSRIDWLEIFEAELRRRGVMERG